MKKLLQVNSDISKRISEKHRDRFSEVKKAASAALLVCALKWCFPKFKNRSRFQVTSTLTHIHEHVVEKYQFIQRNNWQFTKAFSKFN